MLALDTATPRTSAALLGDACEPIERSTFDSPGESAIGLIDALLKEAGTAKSQLTSLAVGVGPGPYTSTRIGVMIALTLAESLAIPVVGICSLDAIARDAEASSGFGIATDARRREIYWAVYDCGSRIAGPAVGKPADVLDQHAVRRWAGAGFDRYPDLVAERNLDVIAPAYPSALAIAQLAISGLARGEQPAAPAELGAHGTDGSGSVAAGQILLAPAPLYLRRPDAVEPTRAAVTGG